MADEKDLIKLGLIIPNVEEFDEDDYDFIGSDGKRYHSPDWLYSIVLEEELNIDVRDTGGDIDKYWEQGWNTNFTRMHRSNFDSYKGRYFKAFPTRYNLHRFVFSKSLRRILKKNEDLKTVIRPLRITPEKEKLFLFHHFARHQKEPRESLAKTYEYIRYFPSALTEICVFKDEKLIACSIFEIGSYSIVSNICFWDVNEVDRSLGTYTILREIQYAQSQGMLFYYLGFYYKQNPNYQYKTRFRGLELFDWDNRIWVDFKNPQTAEMLRQKLPRHKV